MASVGVVRPSSRFQNDTSTSGDADRLPNEMGNMSIRDDRVISLDWMTTSLYVFWQVISS